jgi:hypothetical protein
MQALGHNFGVDILNGDGVCRSKAHGYRKEKRGHWCRVVCLVFRKNSKLKITIPSRCCRLTIPSLKCKYIISADTCYGV